MTSLRRGRRVYSLYSEREIVDSSNHGIRGERRRRKRIVWGSAAALVFFAFFCEGVHSYLFAHGAANFAWLVKLPQTRDARLVGKWQGHAKDPWGGPPDDLTLTLSPDGKAGYALKNDPTTKCEWGTEDGLLYFREFSVDAWGGSTFPYKLSGDGRVASFSGIEEFGPVAPEMRLQTGQPTGSHPVAFALNISRARQIR